MHCETFFNPSWSPKVPGGHLWLPKRPDTLALPCGHQYPRGHTKVVFIPKVGQNAPRNKLAVKCTNLSNQQDNQGKFQTQKPAEMIQVSKELAMLSLHNYNAQQAQ